MKKMKLTVLTAAFIVACLGTQVFAQKAKDSPITFNLTMDGQASVSTSATVADAGLWSQEPKFYKTTGPKKMTQANLIQAIGYVLNQNGEFSDVHGFTSHAELDLVQGELSGFFNVIPGLSNSIAEDGEIGDEAADKPDVDGIIDGGVDSDTTTLPADAVTFLTLDNGRHYQTNPVIGTYPVGHFQPWGQIFIKDPDASGYSSTDPLCVNVTYFFDFQVQECYDCFFLNSFISDATFTEKNTTQGGPPCCGILSTLVGHGKDQYYLSWSFDDTTYNPYLNPNDDTGAYTGISGIAPTVSDVDGFTPDGLAYSDPIKSGLGSPSPYEARFYLNGIMAYTWTLEFVNSTDLLPDFVGTATYTYNGYGFIQLVCQLITGTATITDHIVASDTCCLDEPWADSWYGIGWDGSPDDVVYETDAPGVLPPGTYPTTEENVPLSLTYHNPDWTDAGQGPVTYP